MSDANPISIEPRDDALLATIQCESMDEENTTQIQEQVCAAADQARPLAVILDMSHVSYVPSLSLGVLVDLLRHFKAQDQRFLISGVQPVVREMLAITRLDKLFELCDSTDEALTLVEEARE